MKKNKAFLSAICITLLVGLMSCGDDEPSSVSADKAKAAFDAASQNLANELGSIADAEGFTAMNSLSSVSGSGGPFPFGRMSSYKREDVRDQIKSSVSAFRSILVNSSAANSRVSGDQPFDFNGKKGTYTYNPELDNFDVDLGGDIITIIFPTEGSATNNAEFRLADYAEEATPYGDEAYSPTLVDASLLIEDEVVAELDLDVEYGSDDQPVFADITYFLTPYSVEIKFDDKASTTTSGSETLSKNGETLLGVSLEVTFQSSAKDEEAVKKVTGTLQLMNIKFIVNVNAEDMQTANNYNDIIDIKIKVDGGNAGSVILEQGQDGEPVPFVKYNDGTTDSLQSLFEDLALQLEGILS